MLQQLKRQCDDAAAVGGLVMAMSLMQVGGLPVPASLLCVDYRTMIKLTGGAVDPVKALTQFIAKSPGEGYEVVKGHPHPAIRKVDEIQSTYPGLEEKPIKQLQVTYLQHVPGFGMVQSVFTTPMVMLKESWVPMFDAITMLYKGIPTEVPADQTPVDPALDDGADEEDA
ncbi:MAG: hypothetical protein LBH11_05945 [Propionibacteriaceae bacterium]|nr:hypothetical protein [Propionibacteriaceae bacterium]